MRRLLPALSPLLLLAGCSPDPIAGRRDPGSTPTPAPSTHAAGDDPVVGRWAADATACTKAPTIIEPAAGVDVLYRLRRPGLSCFLSATPIGIAGDLDFPARCRASRKSQMVSGVHFNVNELDDIALEHPPATGWKGKMMEALKRCGAPYRSVR